MDEELQAILNEADSVGKGGDPDPLDAILAEARRAPAIRKPPSPDESAFQRKYGVDPDTFKARFRNNLSSLPSIAPTTALEWQQFGGGQYGMLDAAGAALRPPSGPYRRYEELKAIQDQFAQAGLVTGDPAHNSSFGLHPKVYTDIIRLAKAGKMPDTPVDLDRWIEANKDNYFVQKYQTDLKGEAPTGDKGVVTMRDAALGTLTGAGQVFQAIGAIPAGAAGLIKKYAPPTPYELITGQQAGREGAQTQIDAAKESFSQLAGGRLGAAPNFESGTAGYFGDADHSFRADDSYIDSFLKVLGHGAQFASENIDPIAPIAAGGKAVRGMARGVLLKQTIKERLAAQAARLGRQVSKAEADAIIMNTAKDLESGKQAYANMQAIIDHANELQAAADPRSQVIHVTPGGEAAPGGVGELSPRARAKAEAAARGIPSDSPIPLSGPTTLGEAGQLEAHLTEQAVRNTEQAASEIVDPLLAESQASRKAYGGQARVDQELQPVRPNDVTGETVTDSLEAGGRLQGKYPPDPAVLQDLAEKGLIDPYASETSRQSGRLMDDVNKWKAMWAKIDARYLPKNKALSVVPPGLYAVGVQLENEGDPETGKLLKTLALASLAGVPIAAMMARMSKADRALFMKWAREGEIHGTGEAGLDDAAKLQAQAGEDFGKVGKPFTQEQLTPNRMLPKVTPGERNAEDMAAFRHENSTFINHPGEPDSGTVWKKEPPIPPSPGLDVGDGPYVPADQPGGIPDSSFIEGIQKAARSDAPNADIIFNDFAEELKRRGYTDSDIEKFLEQGDPKPSALDSAGQDMVDELKGGPASPPDPWNVFRGELKKRAEGVRDVYPQNPSRGSLGQAPDTRYAPRSTFQQEDIVRPESSPGTPEPPVQGPNPAKGKGNVVDFGQGGHYAGGLFGGAEPYLKHLDPRTPAGQSRLMWSSVLGTLGAVTGPDEGRGGRFTAGVMGGLLGGPAMGALAKGTGKFLARTPWDVAVKAARGVDYASSAVNVLPHVASTYVGDLVGDLIPSRLRAQVLSPLDIPDKKMDWAKVRKNWRNPRAVERILNDRTFFRRDMAIAQEGPASLAEDFDRRAAATEDAVRGMGVKDEGIIAYSKLREAPETLTPEDKIALANMPKEAKDAFKALEKELDYNHEVLSEMGAWSKETANKYRGNILTRMGSYMHDLEKARESIFTSLGMQRYYQPLTAHSVAPRTLAADAAQKAGLSMDFFQRARMTNHVQQRLLAVQQGLEEIAKAPPDIFRPKGTWDVTTAEGKAAADKAGFVYLPETRGPVQAYGKAAGGFVAKGYADLLAQSVALREPLFDAVGRWMKFGHKFAGIFVTPVNALQNYLRGVAGGMDDPFLHPARQELAHSIWTATTPEGGETLSMGGKDLTRAGWRRNAVNLGIVGPQAFQGAPEGIQGLTKTATGGPFGRVLDRMAPDVSQKVGRVGSKSLAWAQQAASYNDDMVRLSHWIQKMEEGMGAREAAAEILKFHPPAGGRYAPGLIKAMRRVPVLGPAMSNVGQNFFYHNMRNLKNIATQNPAGIPNFLIRVGLLMEAGDVLNHVSKEERAKIKELHGPGAIVLGRRKNGEAAVVSIADIMGVGSTSEMLGFGGQGGKDPSPWQVASEFGVPTGSMGGHYAFNTLSRLAGNKNSAYGTKLTQPWEKTDSLNPLPNSSNPYVQDAYKAFLPPVSRFGPRGLSGRLERGESVVESVPSMFGLYTDLPGSTRERMAASEPKREGQEKKRWRANLVLEAKRRGWSQEYIQEVLAEDLKDE